MTDLSALIETLESATEGSRELDARIVVALDIRPEWCADVSGELWIDLGTTAHSTPSIRLRSGGLKKSTGNPPIGSYLSYTASLDAALSLIPEGWWIDEMGDDIIAQGSEPVKFIGCTVELNGIIAGAVVDVQGEAPTRPLAVCIAALRARQAMETE